MATEEIINAVLAYGAIPVVLGVGKYFMNSYTNRLEKLEQEVAKKTDDQSVRQLLTDKLTPLEEDVHEIRAQLQEIYKILIRKSN